MKQKIKIMKPKQQPSDEEIQSYMNFDRLLENRKVALKSAQNITVFKWSLSVFTVAALVGGFLFLKNNPPVVVADGNQIRHNTAEKSQPISPIITNDSLMEENSSQPVASSKASKNPPTPNGRQSGPEKEPAKSVPQKESPTPIVESQYVQAEPHNGYSDLYNFFNANLVYPAEALKDSIQGVQTISCVINAVGKPEQIEIVNSLGEPFERESRRLIENMPAWKPATLNGKPVASKISLPITFQIQKIKK